MTEIYLIVGTSKKENKVLHVCKDKIKAEHWQELINRQGADDSIVVTIEPDEIEELIDIAGRG